MCARVARRVEIDEVHGAGVDASEGVEIVSYEQRAIGDRSGARPCDILHYGTGIWPRTWTDFAPLYHRARGVASGPEPGGLIPVRCEQDAGGHL